MTKIYTSRNTIGCNIKGDIFVHPDLHKYPKLYRAVIAHEKKHTDSFRGKDVAIDLFNDDLKDNKREFYNFMFSHPRTLLGFLPITKIGKYWGFDLELTVVWILMIAMGWYVGAHL